LSFFEEDDEPVTATRQRRGSSAGGVATDNQTLLIRRAVALGVAALVLILLVVGVRGCMSSSRENGLRDYTREVSGLAADSQRQVGEPFFQLLRQGGNDSPQDLQTAISGYRNEAQTQYDQARRLDVPDDMQAAHRSLLMALEFRRDGLDAIAQRVRTAQGDAGAESERAVNQIAGQMQTFLASDVIYSARTRALITAALRENEITGQSIAPSRFLPGIQWLQPATVAEALGAEGGGTSTNRGEPAPGTHGTGLDSTTVGDLRLNPNGANRIPVADDLTFTVRFTNQGENDETDVRVVVSITGGPKTIRASRTIQQVRQGASAEAAVTLRERPPTGQPVTVNVEVRAVPGEEKTDNNKAEYPAAFVNG
jgi:Domain of unknown function DUF11